MGHTGRRNLVIHYNNDNDDDDGYSKDTVEASLKWTPLVFEKGVRNWNWPLTGMQNYRVCMRVEKKNKQTTGFCEGGHLSI